MNERRIPAGDDRILVLPNVAGDLTVKTWAEREVLAVSQGELTMDRSDDLLSLTCDRDCTLTLPQDFDLQFGRIGGDAQFTGLTGTLEGDKVGGDLRLLHIGPARIGKASGDLIASDVSGDLEIGKVGGDINANMIQGRLSARVGGDLTALALTGGVDVSAGGDAKLEIRSVSTGVHAVHAGGNLRLQLPAQANVTLNHRCGGSLKLGGELASRKGGGPDIPIVLGTGEAVLNLAAGGDLTVWAGYEQSGRGAFEHGQGPVNGEMFAAHAEQTIRQAVDRLEIHLGALASQLDARLSDSEYGEEIAARVHERIQKAMQRAEYKISQAVQAAERSAARAEKRAAYAHGRRPPRQWHATPPPSAQAKRPSASSEESTAILRMVQEGKLSVEQADQLLSALGVEEA